MIPTHAGALMPHGGDPFFSSVAYLHHFNDIGTPTVFTDVQGNVWTATGLAGGQALQTDTVFSYGPKFPPGAGYFANDTGSNPVISFNYTPFPLDPTGQNKFTLECWMAVGPNGVLGTGFSVATLGNFELSVQNRTQLRVTGNFTTGFFTVAGGDFPEGGRFAFAEGNYDGENIRVFLDGVMVAKQAVAPGDPLLVSAGRLGMFSASPEDFMFIDEARFTYGVCRHPSDATYAVPTRAFPNF